MKNNVFKLAMLVFCLVLFVNVCFAEKGKKALPSKATPAHEKLKEPAKKGQPKPSTQAVTSEQISPKEDKPAVEIIPLEPQQTPVLPAPVIDDKGTQIKWQVLSSGGVYGSTPSKQVGGFYGRSPGYQMYHTVSQTAVGYGSSASYKVSQGYWQSAGECPNRGDANGDGLIDIADASWIINWLFINGPPPDPFCVGDVNRDGVVDIADASYIINYLFIGGPPPGF
jgi:hypothetical protein